MDFKLQTDHVELNFGDIIWNNGPLRKQDTTQERTEVVAQRLFILLRSFQGEWFLNTAYGIPYWNILGMKVSKARVDSIFQQKILAEQGVAEIVSFDSTIDRRGYSLSFSVKVLSGEVTDIITI